MPRMIVILGAAALAATTLAANAYSHGVAQTLSLTRIDSRSLNSTDPAPRVVGSMIVNGPAKS